jgi:hypothetical protein
VETVLDSLSTEVSSGITEGPEENIPANLPPAQDGALSITRNLVEEGDQKEGDQRDPHSEIKDVANQQAQAVSFAEGIDRQKANPPDEGNPPWSVVGGQDRADQQQVLAQHRSIDHELQSESPKDRGNSSRPDLQEHVGNALGRVKVWPQGIAAHQPQIAHAPDEATNPLYILAAITLGIPALALTALVGLNPGVQEGTLMTLVTFLVISAVLIAAVFEIKRLADQSSDADHH